MDKQKIIDEIENKVNTYPNWYIGITDNPQRRKGEHDNPSSWHYWNADNENIARNVEKYFLDKLMKGDVGGGNNPTYVYIY